MSQKDTALDKSIAVIYRTVRDLAQKREDLNITNILSLVIDTMKVVEEFEGIANKKATVLAVVCEVIEDLPNVSNTDKRLMQDIVNSHLTDIAIEAIIEASRGRIVNRPRQSSRPGRFLGCC